MEEVHKLSKSTYLKNLQYKSKYHFAFFTQDEVKYLPQNCKVLNAVLRLILYKSSPDLFYKLWQRKFIVINKNT